MKGTSADASTVRGDWTSRQMFCITTAALINLGDRAVEVEVEMEMESGLCAGVTRGPDHIVDSLAIIKSRVVSVLVGCYTVSPSPGKCLSLQSTLGTWLRHDMKV